MTAVGCSHRSRAGCPQVERSLKHAAVARRHRLCSGARRVHGALVACYVFLVRVGEETL